jgi:hypothetical protein
MFHDNINNTSELHFHGCHLLIAGFKMLEPLILTTKKLILSYTHFSNEDKVMR